MAVEFDQAESVEAGSSFCTKPGTYHVMITDYEENPELRGGRIVDGGFKITAEIVDGTEKEEIGKTIESVFYPPNESAKDGGAFALKKMTRFYLAINKGVHQPGVKAVLQYDSVVGRQLVLEMKHREVKEEGKETKKYLELAGLNMWHVDDIAVDGIPKSEEYLSALDPELRIKRDTSAGEGVDLNDI